MRAAIESLPYEQPKLMAVASTVYDGRTFAELLDRAIERSRAPLKLIEAKAVEQQLPPEELKDPFPKLRRRV